GRRVHIDALNLMARLEQILRHRQSHVAEADKSDARHSTLPTFFTADVPVQISRPTKGKSQAARLPKGPSTSRHQTPGEKIFRPPTWRRPMSAKSPPPRRRPTRGRRLQPDR